MQFYMLTLLNGDAFVIRSLLRSLAAVLRWLRLGAYQLERWNVGLLTRARIALLGDICWQISTFLQEIQKRSRQVLMAH